MEPVDELSVAEGVQVYVLAPVAVSVAVLPGHMVAEFTVTVGVGLTVRVDVAVVVHPAAEAAVIVYVVLTVGLAVTVDPVVALRPVDGLQV